MINRSRFLQIISVLALLLFAMSAVSLCIGRYSVDPRDVYEAIRAHFASSAQASPMENVLFIVRIPRILSALLIGASLTISGAVYQSVFRNPLVSPDLLGVSSGASFGAAVAILSGFGLQSLQLFAFVGGILAVSISTSLPRLFRNSSNMMLVLSGIVVSGFMNSALGILKFVAEEQTELSSIVFWQMGSLAKVNSVQLFAVAPTILVCITVLMLLSWRINILSFGEEEARTVGVNVPVLRGIAIVCASLLTASAVSVSGTIGWIGLVMPHFGRLICGSDNTKLLPAAAMLGGCFLLAIDTVARTATALEIPLSILSGLVGVPLYVWLINRSKAKIV